MKRRSIIGRGAIRTAAEQQGRYGGVQLNVVVPAEYKDALVRLAHMHSTTLGEELKWAIYMWATAKGIELNEQ